MTTSPSKPSERSVSAALAPASPPPTITYRSRWVMPGWRRAAAPSYLRHIVGAMTGSVLARGPRAAVVRPARGEREGGTFAAWLCGGLALAVATALYTRFGWEGQLWRDQSIYVYA